MLNYCIIIYNIQADLNLYINAAASSPLSGLEVDSLAIRSYRGAAW